MLASERNRAVCYTVKLIGTGTGGDLFAQEDPIPTAVCISPPSLCSHCMEYIPPVLKKRQTPGGEQSFCFRRQVCDAAKKVYIPLILQKKE